MVAPLETPNPLAAAVATMAQLRALPAPEAIARLVALTTALPTAGDPAACRALALALPANARELPPEVCLALQQLAQALAAYGPRIPDDLRELAPRLRVLWLRTALESGDSACLAALDETDWLRVVTGWSAEAVPSPFALLSHLSRAEDARLRGWVLPQLEPAVQHLALAPQQAFDCLRPLLDDTTPGLRSVALRLVSKCWWGTLSPASQRHRALALERALTNGPGPVTAAAVAACASLALRAPLVKRGDDETTDDDTRALALHALGPLAQAPDLDAALALAARDPLRFGPPVRAFLLEAHRHGTFLRAPHLPGVLDLYDVHLAFTADELLRVTHIVRTELLRLLAELPADDGRWQRRAALLASTVAPGGGRLLGDLLGATTSAANAVAFVEAAGRSQAYSGEDGLLRWLEVIPGVVIPSLRVKGGSESMRRLHVLALDPFCSPEIRTLVLDVLWAHAPDRPSFLRALCGELGPHAAGLLDGRYVTPRDPTLASLLADPPWEARPDHVIEPVERFKVVCESGDIHLLPEVTRLFRELFRGCVRQALAGDFRVKRLQIPELEQMLFRYGRHLIKAGRPVRRTQADTPETGRDLILRVAIEWLGEGEGEPGGGGEAPSSAVCVALLEMLGRHTPDGATLRFIEPYWRRGGANVRRAAIEAILAGEGSQGLELSLCSLVDSPDPRIVTQALAAVALLRATWAEPLARRALERPEMAVKKEAALALAAVGTESSVPTLVRWLAHHDNQSFRAVLLQALAHAAGPSMVAVLVDALDDGVGPGNEAGIDSRRTDLLWQALSGRLTLHSALRLARSEGRAHRDLLDACLAGRVTLADGSADELAARLHQARLRVEKIRLDPARRLRLEGFSPEAALEVASARDGKHDDKLFPTVRAGLAAWVTWLCSTPEVVRLAPLTLVLDAADRGSTEHTVHVDALLDCIEHAQADLEPGTVAGFFERCLVQASVGRAQKMRAIDRLRALAPSARLGGLRRYRLLSTLSAVRTLADLQMCLAECRVRPDLPGESMTLLSEALAIPRPRDGDLPEAVKLFEEARDWYRRDALAASAWVSDQVSRRPIDLPLLPRQPVEPPKPAFHPQSQADCDALVAALSAVDALERTLAATRLLTWADARAAHPRVLKAWLDRHVELPASLYSSLAGVMTDWPEAPADARALALLPSFSDLQLSVFVPRWLSDWEAGDATAETALRGVGQARLLPFVVARLREGLAIGSPNFRLSRLLNAESSLAMRTLIELVGAEAPEEIEHLLPKRKTPRPAETDTSSDPVDPLAGLDLDALVALIDTKGTAAGLAVRAVHALKTPTDAAVAVLERLTTDKRPTVRSAALRALRALGSRAQTLEAALSALKMETRKDVVLQLMSSLGHGRHEPALPELLERLVDREPRVRAGAHAALRAWGAEIVPAVRHAARRARPDRQPYYEALLAELVPASGD